MRSKSSQRGAKDRVPEKKAPTALITGASSGIGFELAQCFAKRGYQLIIIGRDAKKLEQLERTCASEFNAPVLSLNKDLTGPDAAEEIASELQRRRRTVDVLVNNAGMGLWGEFSGTKAKLELDLVQLHIVFMLSLTKQILPMMRARGAGKILNVGSVYSFTPVPLQSVYAASKAFIWSFSMALREEVRQEGVSVTFLSPGITYTRFRTRAGIPEKKSIFGMSSESVADIAFRGLMEGKAVVIPGLFNKFYVGIGRFIPARWIQWIVYKARGLKIHAAN